MALTFAVCEKELLDLNYPVLDAAICFCTNPHEANWIVEHLCNTSS